MFGFEAGDDLFRIHAQLNDLQRYFAADRLVLLGHVDHTHATFADIFPELVGTDLVTKAIRDAAVYCGD